MPSTTPPTMSPTRVFISRAALLVKVTAKISPGRARPVARMWAMRTVSTRVLPVPAPASTSTGPSSVSTASRCSGLSPVRYGAPAACARAAIPPGAGAGRSTGSMLRFKGSATGSAKPRAYSDSHAPKMASEGGFYEAIAPRNDEPGPPSLHIRVDQHLGAVAVLLQQRDEIGGRAGGGLEEILVGEVLEFLALENRQQRVVQLRCDQRRRAGRDDHAPVDRSGRIGAEARLGEGRHVRKIRPPTRPAQRQNFDLALLQLADHVA